MPDRFFKRNLDVNDFKHKICSFFSVRSQKSAGPLLGSPDRVDIALPIPKKCITILSVNDFTSSR